MHLDDRPFEDLERVEYRDGRERVAGRVDDDRIGLLARGLNEIDQRPLVVGLMERRAPVDFASSSQLALIAASVVEP
jgi:hypothetical protein